jgi:hypothetical protein
MFREEYVCTWFGGDRSLELYSVFDRTSIKQYLDNPWDVCNFGVWYSNSTERDIECVRRMSFDDLGLWVHVHHDTGVYNHCVSGYRLEQHMDHKRFV